MEKTGIVEFIAKTGGIKFKDDPQTWYNPTREIKQKINSSLRGAKITIMHDENNKFNQLFMDAAIKDDTITKEDYWQNRELREIENNKRISRHGALNTAIELLKTTSGTHTFEDAIKIANRVLEWVNK